MVDKETLIRLIINQSDSPLKTERELKHICKESFNEGYEKAKDIYWTKWQENKKFLEQTIKDLREGVRNEVDLKKVYRDRTDNYVGD